MKKTLLSFAPKANNNLEIVLWKTETKPNKAIMICGAVLVAICSYLISGVIYNRKNKKYPHLQQNMIDSEIEVLDE